MEEEKIPYIAYESILARHERITKRLTFSLCLAILLIVISNMCWLYAWCQYDYTSDEITTTSVTQDGKGQNIYGDNNRVNDGTKNSSSTGQAQKKTEKER